MGKRGKEKRKSKKYSKSQFIDIICRHCSLCNKYPNPTFCYGKMYLRNPKIFMDKCYIQLMNASVWLENNIVPNIDLPLSVQEFKRIFCYSNICGNERAACQDVLVCYELFRYQTKEGNVLHDSKKGKRKKPKDDPYIFEAYPSFFLSNDKKWEDEVKGILSNGD